LRIQSHFSAVIFIFTIIHLLHVNVLRFRVSGKVHSIEYSLITCQALTDVNLWQ